MSELLEKKRCGNCAHFEILKPEEKTFMGISDEVIAGRCNIHDQMMDDNWPCTCVESYDPISDMCIDMNYKEHGEKIRKCE